MSSSEWETVTKSRKQRNLEKKVIAHTELKEAFPKLEELMPEHQYRNLLLGKPNINSNRTNNDNSSKTKSKSPSKKLTTKQKTQDNMETPPVAVKKQLQSQPPVQPPKVPARPRSLEQAMRMITADEFNSKLAQLKLSYPGSELRWLSNIAGFFNNAFSYESDPTFAGKSIFYPSLLASADLKTSLIEFFESVGFPKLEHFYYTLLDNMAIELNNNLPVIGYKFLLQIIGQNWPTICSNSLAKTAVLRNSYQNRSSIGLSILWTVGQGGYQVLTEGIKVWRNIMLPILEMRQYTKFIVEYIEKVLTSAADQSISLNQTEFFEVYKTLQGNYINIPKEHQASLKRSASVFLKKYIVCSAKHANIFLTLLRDIESESKNRTEIDGCISCLLNGNDTFKVWKMNYKKQPLPSTLLMKEIVNNWDNSTHTLAESDAFQSFLSDAQQLNTELKNTKISEEHIDSLIDALETIQEKSISQQKKNKQNSEQKKKCGCCKWVLGSFLVIALIAGAICYDTETNGKGHFERSATGKLLKQAGVLPHVQKAWYTSMSASARGYKWAEHNVPPYMKPVGELLCNLFKLTRNALCSTCTILKETFVAKWPVVANFVDQYVPGLSEKVEVSVVTVSQLILEYFVFLKKEFLIGRLSPENLSKTLNDTQNVALEYYGLFQKKVDAYAKLK